jgi:haloalkane dehalogenase
MAYVETGSGDPIVFLHGNPTSSYLWRNVIPHLEGLGRCIAPDLIGMGDSDKLEPSGPHRYRFVEHRQYLDELLATLGVSENVTLVGHDWGSALGFDWANRHRGWAQWPETIRKMFKDLRSPAGEEMLLQKNLFVEAMLPAAFFNDTATTEMEVYRRPYREPGESRRPTLTWPREIPFDGEPADVAEIMESYAAWLPTSDLPKLFINAEPGVILVGTQREFCRRWPNQREVTVEGMHFVQEDSPREIGLALADWIPTLG